MYIKKLVMQGFKSFPKKTELPFTKDINVILGPNGSGKSNISDALCFVLGRLSIKSMRAAKAGNLIFLGAKSVSPSKEAIVEIVFDNSNRSFSIDSDEVSIKRIVRKKGQSIYKINKDTKTRQEVLFLLAQAGIDPNGFNIILQGEIQNFVAMQGEERRKIIEEVSGISVYELRKEKSLRELEKTEERLKEISAILRERTAYLNNLEKERQQALRFKKLEENIKRCKASIISYDLNIKRKHAEKVDDEIERKNKEIEKIKKSLFEIESSIKEFESKIDLLNSIMQKSAGLEQEKLNREIADIRAELVGAKVKLESHERKLSLMLKQKQEFEESIKTIRDSVKKLQEKSPTVEKKQKELESKKREMEELENRRKKFYLIKSELKSIKEKLQDRSSLLQKYTKESDIFLEQMKSLTLELFDEKSDEEKLNKLKSSSTEKKEIFEKLNKQERELEKISYANESEIEKQKKIVENISRMDICPLCKNKITSAHISSIKNEVNPIIDALKKQIDSSDKELSLVYAKKDILVQEISQFSLEILKRESDLIKLSSINEKKERIKALVENIEELKNEILKLEKRKKILERDVEDNFNVEQKCETIRVEIQEISLRSKENVDSEILFKQREMERAEISFKQLSREESDLHEDISELKKAFEGKQKSLNDKQKKEEELVKKFKKLIQERDTFQMRIREFERTLLEKQNILHNEEQHSNELKIDKARVYAEAENLETELREFSGVEIIKTNRDSLVSRLENAQETLLRIGSVNMRSLEVYDSVKKEYELINNKVEIIQKEKQSILKIIHEVDTKKKKTFFHTFNSLNEIFSRNFSQLSSKGHVSLELENRKEPFEEGISIIVKAGHGKYFDVKSLSGGEQTLVALSLIFAIQELKPYPFYILDEVDAALDKQNSARLASLLKKYMQHGQYIVITHNDEIITNATNLYGVSMHDGISKITSLRV